MFLRPQERYDFKPIVIALFYFFFVQIFELSIILLNVNLNLSISVALVLMMSSDCVSCVTFMWPVNCPVDNINIKVVVSNLAVAEQIGELLVHCRYGVEPMLTNSNSAAANNCTEQYQVNPHGCPVTIRASARRYIRRLSLLLISLLLFSVFTA